MLLCVNLFAHAFRVRQWCLRFFTKAEVPWVPENFQVGASGSPTACHVDIGNGWSVPRLLMLDGTIVVL